MGRRRHRQPWFCLAGLVALGDLADALASADPIVVQHRFGIGQANPSAGRQRW